MPYTILIVEDHDDTRQFMRLLVESFGCRVIEAANGAEAVERVKLDCVNKACPDLILMDIGLPVMDGIAATKQIRRLKEGTNIPVIAVTAHMEWFEEKALRTGCNRVITKPIEHGFLKQIISDYMLPRAS